MWSDGCQYQNKNAVKETAIRRFARKYKVTVVWKYLQVGHTFMEGDSAHRCIENKVKKQDVNIPQDYISIIKHAREKKPYKVRFDSILPHTFFKDYEYKQDVQSIRPGTKAHDPTVADIKQLKFTPGGDILYKLAHDAEEFQLLPVMRRLGEPEYPDYPPLNSQPRPITYKKYKHLQELKPTIPSFFHLYYDDLPHTGKPATEEEDPTNEDFPTEGIKTVSKSGEGKKKQVRKVKVQNKGAVKSSVVKKKKAATVKEAVKNSCGAGGEGKKRKPATVKQLQQQSQKKNGAGGGGRRKVNETQYKRK